MPGTSALCAAVFARSFDAFAFNGIYNCRPPRGGAVGTFSAHAEGRAFDLNGRLANGNPDPAPIPIGSQTDIAARAWMQRLANLHVQLGVQRMIYKDTLWQCDKGFSKAGTALALEHANHIHVEQRREEAANLKRIDIERILDESEDDMFTDADRALLTKVGKQLDDYFGIDAQGNAKDIRKKIDQTFIHVSGDDHPELIAGRVKALAEGTAPPKV